MSANTWGRSLLATMGVILTLAGLMLIVLPFIATFSGLVAVPGVGVLGLGVLLVVLSAYYDSSAGAAQLLGWRIRFGKVTADQQKQLPESDEFNHDEDRHTDSPAADSRKSIRGFRLTRWLVGKTRRNKHAG